MNGTGQNGTYTGFVINGDLVVVINGPVDKIFGKRLRLGTGVIGLVFIFVTGNPCNVEVGNLYSEPKISDAEFDT